VKSEDIYSDIHKDFLQDIEEDYREYCSLYNWEDRDWEENKYMYEYDLEHLEELAKRQKM